MNDERRAGPGLGLWIGLVAGLPVMAYGAMGLWRNAGPTGVREVAAWVIGADVGHDLLLAPLIIVIAWFAGRAFAPGWRAPVCSGVLASLLVVALAAPGLSGLGNDARNPTVHPFDQVTAVVWALGAIWSGVALWCGLLLVNRRRKRPPSPTR